MSIKQRAGFLFVYMYMQAQQTKQTNKWLRHHICFAYKPSTQCQNAMETQYIHQKRRASALKSPCKHHEMPPKTPQERGRTQGELRSNALD